MNVPAGAAFDARMRAIPTALFRHALAALSVAALLPVFSEPVTTTLAGSGVRGSGGDGAAATLAKLDNPFGVVRGPDGAIWFCEYDGQVVRHIAGTGAKGFTGNGGPAKEATFAGPKGISVGPGGDVYLADTENHAVRKIDAKSGRIELVVGAGEKGDGPEGDPLKCRLSRPHGIFVDRDGTLLIGDSENHRIVRLLPPG